MKKDIRIKKAIIRVLEGEEEIDYVKEFMKLSEKEKMNMTWDDFFDEFNLPKKLRHDYLVGCILKGVNKIKNGHRKFNNKSKDTNSKEK